MPEVVEWQFNGGGGLQVYIAPERAGHSSCTLVVTDIDALAQHLRSSGIAPDAKPVLGDRVDLIMINDPDGNTIALAPPEDSTQAR
jgi:hypothetical protein